MLLFLSPPPPTWALCFAKQSAFSNQERCIFPPNPLIWEGGGGLTAPPLQKACNEDYRLCKNHSFLKVKKFQVDTQGRPLALFWGGAKFS